MVVLFRLQECICLRRIVQKAAYIQTPQNWLPQVGDLKSMFEAGGAQKDTKLVFISSCSSERAGNAFAEAGVPHVVAVKDGHEVSGGYCFCCCCCCCCCCCYC